jgi:hypothetical protein
MPEAEAEQVVILIINQVRAVQVEVETEQKTVVLEMVQLIEVVVAEVLGITDLQAAVVDQEL